MVIGMGNNGILRDAAARQSTDMVERRSDPARFPAVVGPAVYAFRAALPEIEPRLRTAFRCGRPRRAGVAVDRRGKHDA
ncbi:MAG: hypothetical protein OXG16_11485 [Rhodospirillales bacterium]|nr:hypothetical protein [Rhodospirillales bacterium]MDE0712950.1 hypothetical protein [Rhodospirillales bacterium]